jgi:hypothetical protein
MVGKDTRINLARELDKYRNIPFLRGSNSVDWNSDKKGLDCIGFIYAFYTNLGIQMPDKIILDSGELINNTNYGESFKKYGKRIVDFYLYKYYDMFGTEILPNKVIIGDAIIVKAANSPHLIPGIYGGNNLIFACSIERGVQTFSIGIRQKMPIIKARRVID